MLSPEEVAGWSTVGSIDVDLEEIFLSIKVPFKILSNFEGTLFEQKNVDLMKQK
jgi:hypothetical protein